MFYKSRYVKYKKSFFFFFCKIERNFTPFDAIVEGYKKQRQKSKTDLLTFNFCHFSPLSFNFCQYSPPLELSYLFSLSGRLTFSSFFYIIIFIIKRKLKKVEKKNEKKKKKKEREREREREKKKEKEASKGNDVVPLI